MPKPAFRCVNCFDVYNTSSEARACEAVHVVEARRTGRDEMLEKHFPGRHKKDDRYNKHCVKCGTPLVKWEREFEGHRAERGRVTLDVARKTLLGGLRCLECHEEVLDDLAKMVDDKH